MAAEGRVGKCCSCWRSCRRDGPWRWGAPVFGGLRAGSRALSPQWASPWRRLPALTPAGLCEAKVKIWGRAEGFRLGRALCFLLSHPGAAGVSPARFCRNCVRGCWGGGLGAIASSWCSERGWQWDAAVLGEPETLPSGWGGSW